MGMAMPIINLAVQNEFAQKDLGSVTASVQLFRGLGSTIGTALLSGVLTAGIVSAIGSPQKIPYIATLQKSPVASQMFEGEIDADALLRINIQKDVIKNQATASLWSAQTSQAIRDAQIAALEQQQVSYSRLILQAFTDSLHRVFLISASLMFVGLSLLVFLREKPLQETSKLVSGE